MLNVPNVKFLAHLAHQTQKRSFIRCSKCQKLCHIWTVLLQICNGTDENGISFINFLFSFLSPLSSLYSFLFSLSLSLRLSVSASVSSFSFFLTLPLFLWLLIFLYGPSWFRGWWWWWIVLVRVFMGLGWFHGSVVRQIKLDLVVNTCFHSRQQQ